MSNFWFHNNILDLSQKNPKEMYFIGQYKNKSFFYDTEEVRFS